jgi:ceramide glucosyltransferase
MSAISWYLAAGIALWALLVLHYESARRALLRPPAPPPAAGPYPSLSVIHPVRGLDAGYAANVAAALDMDYPGEVEDIFVFDDDAEPGIAVVRAALAARPGRRGHAWVLIAGSPRPGYTGKLSAMNAGVAAARGEIIAFTDSDIRVDRDIVRVLVDLLRSNPRAGSVFAPVVVSEPARTPGDVGYQIMLNSLYSPDVARWGAGGRGLPFIMGQLMVFGRDTLTAIGSVDCARGQLVDDMNIGTHVVAAGLENVMSGQPVRIIEGGLGFGDFLRNARRWLVFSRSGIPGRFAVGPALHFLGFWAGLLALAEGWAAGSAPLALLGLALALTAGAIVLGLNRATGAPPTPPRFWWMAYLMLLAGPFVYVTTWIWPEIRWRGRLYQLNARAQLDTEHPRLFARVRRALHA